MATGDASISSLLQHGTTKSRLATRNARVKRELQDATAKLDQALRQAIFLYLQNGSCIP